MDKAKKPRVFHKRKKWATSPHLQFHQIETISSPSVVMSSQPCYAILKFPKLALVKAQNICFKQALRGCCPFSWWISSSVAAHPPPGADKDSCSLVPLVNGYGGPTGSCLTWWSETDFNAAVWRWRINADFCSREWRKGMAGGKEEW